MKTIPYVCVPGKKIPASIKKAAFKCHLNKPTRIVRVCVYGNDPKALKFNVACRCNTKKGQTLLRFGITYEGFIAMLNCASQAVEAWKLKAVKL